MCLIGAHRRAGPGLARYTGAEIPKTVERPVGRAVRAGGNLQTRIEHGSDIERILQAFFANTGQQRIPYEVHERNIGYRQHTGPFDEIQPFVIDQPVTEMFDPVAMVGARLRLYGLFQ